MLQFFPNVGRSLGVFEPGGDVGEGFVGKSVGRQETAGVKGGSVVVSVSGEEVSNRVFGSGPIFDDEIGPGEGAPPATESSVVRLQKVSAGEEFG